MLWESGAEQGVVISGQDQPIRGLTTAQTAVKPHALLRAAPVLGTGVTGLAVAAGALFPVRAHAATEARGRYCGVCQATRVVGHIR